MSVACTSCGHAVPLGQFRCGKCGAAQTRDQSEDLDASSEVALDEALATRKQPVPGAGSRPEISGTTPGDLIVPRGTFASEEPVTTVMSANAPKTPSAAVPTAAQTTPREGTKSNPLQPAAMGAGLVVPAAATTASELSSTKIMLPKPPFLASEILREDLMPAEPGRDTMRRALRIFGAFGLLVSVWSFGAAPFALAFIGALALLFISALRVAHITRAILVASIACAGLAAACAWRIVLGGAVEEVLLALSTPSLAAALFFRAWYRSSQSARALVAVSFVCCAAWALSTADASLLSLDWSPQSWLPALTWCVFVILCVLSLLAFMDDGTTGACNVWASILLSWYVVRAVAHPTLTNLLFDRDLLTATLGLIQPMFAGPLAVALAQLLARGLGRQPRAHQVLLRRNV